MKLASLASLTLPLVIIAACGGGDDTSGDDVVDPPDAVGLDRCGDGAVLEELWNVNNLHGEIIAMTAAADGTVVLATTDGAVKQWSLGLSSEVAPLPGGRPSYGEPLTEAGMAVRALAVDAEGGRILGGDINGSLRMWHLEDAVDMGTRELATVPLTAVVSRSVYDVVVADESFGGAMRTVPLDGGEPGIALPTVLWNVTTMAIDGERLYTAGDDYGKAAVELRSVAFPTETLSAWNTEEIDGWVRDVEVSPDGAVLAVGGDGYLVTLDAEDLTAGPTAHVVSAPVLSVAFTATGDHVAVATSDGRVALWNRALTGEVAVLDVVDPVAVAVDPSGERLVVASKDGRLRALVCR